MIQNVYVSRAVAVRYGLIPREDFESEESDISNNGMRETDVWYEQRLARRERLEFQMLLEQIQAGDATKSTDSSDDEDVEFGSLCFQQGSTNLNHRPSTGLLERRRQRRRHELGRYRHRVERRTMDRVRDYQAQRQLKGRQYLDELTEQPMIPPQITPADLTGQPKIGN